MNCINPKLSARKYQAIAYRGHWIHPHPNAASRAIFGVRREGERKMFAGPFATRQEAELAIDRDIEEGR